MIIKLKIANPAFNEDFRHTSNEGHEISEYAWEYIGDVVAFVEHEAVDGSGNVVKMLEIIDTRGETNILYVLHDAYVMNNEGKTINIIRPYTKPKNNAFAVYRLLSALSLEGVYRGDRLLTAASIMAEGKWDHDRIVSEKDHGGINPDLYKPVHTDDIVKEDDFYKLFAGHSKYNGCSVIHAIEKLASTGVIAPPLPIEEEEKLRKLGKYNCIVCDDRSKCAACDK